MKRRKEYDENPTVYMFGGAMKKIRLDDTLIHVCVCVCEWEKGH